MKDYSKAYSEVYYILETLGDAFKTKLPVKLLKLIEYNKKKDFAFEEMIDEETGLLLVSRDALIMLSVFNMKYWEEDETEKEKLTEIYEENTVSSRVINEQPKKIEIEPDKYEDKKENKFMVVVDENSIMYKIKKFIRKIIGKWRDK